MQKQITNESDKHSRLEKEEAGLWSSADCSQTRLAARGSLRGKRTVAWVTVGRGEIVTHSAFNMLQSSNCTRSTFLRMNRQAGIRSGPTWHQLRAAEGLPLYHLTQKPFS